MRWIRDIALPYSGDDCLTWPFAKHPSGYAFVGRKGKNIPAHRYICELVNGAPPTPQYQAAHSCGNGHLWCVNPKHLSWKTPTENQLESSKDGRRWKLTPDAVAEIRRTAPHERADIAAIRFGVSERTIRRVRSGDTWPTGTYRVGGFAVNPWTAERRAKHTHQSKDDHRG